MSNQLNLLDKNTHKDVAILPHTNFAHLKEQHMAPVVVHEFPNAAAEYPIVFVKRDGSEEFQPVALMGLKANENLYAGQDKWPGIYVPASITHYPLVLVPSQEDENRLLVAIVEGSELVSKEADKGQKLFNDDGSESEALTKRKEALITQFEYTQVTRNFCKTVSEMGLVKEQNLTLEVNGEKRNITGIHMIDEEKLRDLGEKEFAILKEKNYLGPIYAQMLSMQQMHRLIRKHLENTAA